MKPPKFIRDYRRDIARRFGVPESTVDEWANEGLDLYREMRLGLHWVRGLWWVVCQLGGRWMDAYLIWSNEHKGWWRANSSGYTKNLVEAGHYGRDQALAICRQAIMTAPHINMISELPVRVVDVMEFLDRQPMPAAIATMALHSGTWVGRSTV